MKKYRFLLALLVVVSFSAYAQNEDDELSLDDVDSTSSSTSEVPAQNSKDEFSDFEDEVAGSVKTNPTPAESSKPAAEVVSPEVAQPVAEPSAPAADPLDVLEDKKSETAEKEAPSVPQFTEVPEADQQTPPPETEPMEEIAKPEVPAEVLKEEVKTAVRPSPTKNVLTPDEPDKERELRFHRIYSKYNQAPTSVESWEAVLGNRSSQIYQVQRGDTLWDVSKTLFGDSNYWPKVWSLNTGSILNPHEISPKLEIRFYPGSQGDVPTLALQQKTMVPDVIVVEREVEGKTVSEKITTQVLSRPVVKSIPESLPQYRYKSLEVAPPLDFDIRRPVYPEANQPLSYFVSQQPVQGIGKVIETEMGLSSAMDYQKITVKLNPGIEPGTFGVMKTKEVINVSKLKSAPKAFMVEVQGEIEILGVVNAKESLYRALVKKAINPVEVGAVLTNEKIKEYSTAAGAVASAGAGRVIGGEWSARRDYVGTSNLVFLESTNGSIAEGDILSVLANQKLRNSNTLETEGARAIGKVRVVHVDGKFVTAYVLQAEEEIMMGDRVAGAGSEGSSF